ncbi:MAG: sigma-70 family RNA polymerase sigma factor [Planctomycetaceae bacterium]
MSRYHNPAMKQLTDQQVRFAPRDARLSQIDKAERLLAEIDMETDYRYQDIYERITSYRPDRYPDLFLTGEDAAHDLRCFVEDLSDSADIRVENIDEPVLTVADVSERYSVSTKTVDRWRNKGLVSRRFRFGNRKRIGFLKSSLDRFVDQHSEEVSRGRNFKQLSNDEREEIVRRARRMARYGGCPSEISRRLARKLKRSPETIRYTLKNYDRDHPENAVFPNSGEVLTDQHKKDIYTRFRRGESADRLSKRFCRTKTSIYRIVAEVRAKRLLEQPIDFMHSDEFTKKDADATIFGPPPEIDKKGGRLKPPPGLPPYLASLYAIPLLVREEEQYFFRKMNYLKFKAAMLQAELDSIHPKTGVMNEIERLLDKSQEIKNFLIRSNLRLVVSIAKRHIRPNSNFFEMVSDGNMSLIRAIEKFDYTKGNKFSTYASWAIMKNYARTIPAEHRQLDRYRTGNEEVFGRSRDDRANQFYEELVNTRQREIIGGILDHLDDREKDIIVQRFGLEDGVEPKTLEQVGQRLGVTKERIRQLEARALSKLRKITQDEKLDIPGI